MAELLGLAPAKLPLERLLDLGWICYCTMSRKLNKTLKFIEQLHLILLATNLFDLSLDYDLHLVPLALIIIYMCNYN